MKEILKLKNVSKKYQAKNGEVEALSNISFSVNEGEFVSIIGPSGCGKSTLLSIISAKPKFRTFGVKSFSNTIFEGFILQWITPFLCA